MMSMSSMIHSTARIDNPTHVINLSKQVLKVEMSPYEWSHNLLCIAHIDEIIIGIVKFQEEDEEMEEEIEFEAIQSFKIDSRVHCLSWSPETSLNIIPKSIVFACGTASHIYIYSSNVADKTAVQVLKGHRSYVNALAYEPDSELLASASDDLTCRLWAVKDGGTCISTFVLQSPGVSVCWHNADPSKLLVAERGGTVRLYSVERQQALLSMDTRPGPLSAADWAPADCSRVAALSGGVSVCWHNADPGKLLVAERGGTVRLYSVERQQALLSMDTRPGPLSAADWAPADCSRVAALSGGHLVLWDITRPSQPVDVRLVHANGGSALRYSLQSEHHVATLGHAGELKVTHTGAQHPACHASLTLAGGLTWTFRLPFVCVGKDRSVCFFKIATK